MHKACLAIPALVFMLLAPMALGQEAKPSDSLRDEHSIHPVEIEGGNAALEYFRLWDSLTQAERTAFADAHNAKDFSADGARLDKSQRQVCMDHQDYIQGLIRAANMQHCDWGVQWQYGEEFLLPHLSLMRATYRVLKMDVYRCAEDKDHEGAAARMAALVRLSNQFRTDRAWISVLVAEAINGGACSAAKDLIKRGSFTPASAKTLLEAYRSLGTFNLYGAAEAAEGEHQMLAWHRRTCTGANAGAAFLVRMNQYRGWSPQFLEWTLAAMGEQQLTRDLNRLDTYFERAVALWRRPDGGVGLAELSTEASEYQYGIAASMMAPQIDVLRRSEARARREVREVEKELEPIARQAMDAAK